MSEENGWKEWKEAVLYRLDSLNKKYESLDTKVEEIVVDLTVLKTKMAAWGAGGGGLVFVILEIIERMGN